MTDTAKKLGRRPTVTPSTVLAPVSVKRTGKILTLVVPYNDAEGKRCQKQCIFVVSNGKLELLTADVKE